MASREMFWVLSALLLCSKFVGGTAFEARFGWDGLEILSTTAESTHTADQLPAFDESLFEWETRTSKNGASFRVGREKTDCVKAAVGKTFSKDVNWPADGQWKATSHDIQDVTGIQSLKLFNTLQPKHRYNFQFIITDNYDYSFEVESGESFEDETTQTGLNVLNYDAKLPTIKRVTGS